MSFLRRYFAPGRGAVTVMRDRTCYATPTWSPGVSLLVTRARAARLLREMRRVGRVHVRRYPGLIRKAAS